MIFEYNWAFMANIDMYTIKTNIDNLIVPEKKKNYYPNYIH